MNCKLQILSRIKKLLKISSIQSESETTAKYDLRPFLSTNLWKILSQILRLKRVGTFTKLKGNLPENSKKLDK